MAYDRYDPRDTSRYGRPRSSDEFDRPRYRSERDDRGFFERAGDEIASWFGDDDSDRRRERDYGGEERHGRYEPAGRSRSRYFAESRFDRDQDRIRGRDYPMSNRGGYRPMGGDSDRFDYGSGGYRGDRGRFEERGYGSAGGYGSSSTGRDFDPHYRSWRDQQISQLDRDYDDYRRENQSRFERDFGTWRDTRMQKRGLLGQIREHMEVVGNDDEHVGTVDRVAGDRIILTKSDPESGGAHHSLSCGMIDRVEDNRVILDCTADQAKQDWRDENRSRALFEREDQGEVGPHVLNRSFEGTYR